nr:amidohydrolase family protein [Gemmatimonadaceae bacterium]
MTKCTIGAALLISCVGAVTAGAQQATAIRNVRLFDGDSVTAGMTVVASNGRIVAIGADAAVPAGATVIDGAGRTLLPGLVDAHTHTMSVGQLRSALAFGVSVHLDMFTAPQVMKTLAVRSPGHADLHTAGVIGTPPGGHGTQFGVPIPTISNPADAASYVADRVADGSEWIKVAVDDFGTYGGRRATLDSATVAAIVREAHAHNLKVVAHVASLAAARAVIGAGVDGLVHIWTDRTPPAAFLDLMRARGTFVIPTMTVTTSLSGTGGSAALAADPRVAPMITPADEQNARASFTPNDRWTASIDSANASLASLVRAGIPLLAGTDAPNPGTIYGASMHRELELLVSGGLTPVQALRAATSIPARAFGITGAGTVAVGGPATFVLVDGDPTADITATRAIVDVFKDGVRFDRARYRDEVASVRQAAAAPVVKHGAGMVSNFEEGRPSSTVGAGWVPSTDAMAGGTSTATLEVVEGGAAATSRALVVRGTVNGGTASPWAGAMWFPAAQPMQPADLSATGGLQLPGEG